MRYFRMNIQARDEQSYPHEQDLPGLVMERVHAKEQAPPAS